MNSKLDDLDHLVPLCVEAARRHDVVPDVHPDDFIFRFLLSHPSFPEPRIAADYYFDDGARSAQKIAALIAAMGGRPPAFSLLDFASGYGCVTRHLRRTLPEARITACDIHAGAVSFIQQKLGVTAILSHAVPERFSGSGSFDVILALSFFSHMPRRTWTRWLSALLSALASGGLLIFTTHGLESRRYFSDPPLDLDGFWFERHSEQGDLDSGEYGSTIVAPAFVFREAAGLQQRGRIVHFREAAWWEHQDLYVMRRP